MKQLVGIYAFMGWLTSIGLYPVASEKNITTAEVAGITIVGGVIWPITYIFLVRDDADWCDKYGPKMEDYCDGKK